MKSSKSTWVQNKRISVLGAARSGAAAAIMLRSLGAEVLVSDSGIIPGDVNSHLRSLGCVLEDGGHTERACDVDFIVTSPGVPGSASPLKTAIRRGISVYSEIEVASWFCEAPVVAITGSNGKTTTTELLGHVFRNSGRRTWVCGNVGTPFSGVTLQASRDDIVILEVSSFQLDHIDGFKPGISILLNITGDHLDRYEQDIELYAQSKLSICRNQDRTDAFIFNADDDRVRVFADGLDESGPICYPISTQRQMGSGGFIRDEILSLIIDNKEEELMHMDKLALRGRHNVYNSLAAAVAARVMEVRSDVVRESLHTFEGVPHRLEQLREVDGVRYVNDSKATNVNALWYAIESFSEPLVLIAGGRDKGNDYSSLRPLIQNRVRALISIGEAAETIHAELGSMAEESVIAGSLGDAVKLSHLLAKPGDVVLLSPACSSFDMFDSYEHRGDLFRQLVSNL